MNIVTIGRTVHHGLLIAALTLLSGRAMAQSTATATATIVGAGYSAPSPSIKAAPGQVLSLIVSGFEYRLQSPVIATSLPLPATLAGFSVTVNQGGPQNSFVAPLFGVEQSPCVSPTGGSCPAITILSVQIPFEVIPDCLRCARPSIFGYVVVSDRGVDSTSMHLSVPGDNIHLVDPCDTTASLDRPRVLPCGKLVLHTDGRPVEASRPARVGEELVMYALGLGQTQPLVPTGMATPSPPPPFPNAVFALHFDYTPNAPPSRNYRVNAPLPVYVGLVPGFVGLYQINFVVPPITAGFSSCGSSIVPVPIPVVTSSLTVTLDGPFSFDGVGICVLQ